MNYIQLRIEATEENQDLLIGLLSPLNATGFEQTATHLVAYFEEDPFESYDVYAILKKFTYQIQTIKEENWNAAWEASFQPVIVGQFCAVRAHFHPPVTSVQHEIIITPKMSFGTGHHATTFMMLEQMQALDFRNKTVLDFGTGTGVLAILAEKLGAAKIVAIDNDTWSFENVQENIQLNHCAKILPQLTAEISNAVQYDIVLANITKNVLLGYLDRLKTCIHAGGYVVMSGLLETDSAEMLAACEKWGMKLVQKKVREQWLSLLFSNETETN